MKKKTKGRAPSASGRRRARRTWGILLAALLCVECFWLGSSATEAMPDGYGAVREALPEEILEQIPEDLLSEDSEAAGKAVEQVMSAEYLLGLLRELVGAELGSAMALLMKLCGLLILSAVFGAFRESLSSDALAGAVRFCSSSAIFASVISFQVGHLRQVQQCLERLTSLMSAMIPVAGGVWAMGGNVSTATAGTVGMYAFLTVCQRLCASALTPICCFCTALALCSALSPDMGVRGLGGAVKKIYTFVLGLVMTILVTSLGSQTTLTAAADGMTARAAKMASAAAIPIVGGSVGDTLRTVAAGVQYLKGVVGIGGIFLILLLVLPVLLSLLMTRLAFLLGGGVADVLGCDAEGRLLGELGNVYGCMLAVLSMSAVMFILALVIFIKTAVAVG